MAFFGAGFPGASVSISVSSAVPDDGSYIIVSEKNPSLCLTIAGGASNAGAKLIVDSITGAPHQRFVLDPQGSIRAMHSGLVLDVEGGAGQGRKIIQWQHHGGENQRWKVHGDGTIRLQSQGLALDIEGGNDRPGTHVIAWPHHGQSNQRWRLTKPGPQPGYCIAPVPQPVYAPPPPGYGPPPPQVGFAPPPGFAPPGFPGFVQPGYAPPPPQPGFYPPQPQIFVSPVQDYVIVSEKNPRLVLDIEGGSSSQGAKLIVWERNGGPNQRFRIDPSGCIRAAHSGLVLDVEGGAEQGRKIIQWQQHGGENQRWQVHPDGTIRLQSRNLCLDIEGGNDRPGTHVIAWPHHGQANQRWRLTPA